MSKRKQPRPSGSATKGKSADVGEHLRSLRAAREITGQELARRLGTSQAAVSKIETGIQEPTLDYLVRFASELGLSTSETRGLVARLNLSPAGKHVMDVLEPVAADLFAGDKTKRQQSGVEHLEGQASDIRTFQPLAVPNLVQTADYARSVLRLAGGKSHEGVEQEVEARIKRQKQLAKKTSVAFVLSEGALRGRVSSNPDMVAQVHHLQSVIDKANVRLGLIPWSTRLMAVPCAGFTIFDSKLAFVEVPHGKVVLTKGGDVEIYVRLFEALQRMAVFDDAARILLGRIAKDYERLEELEQASAVPSMFGDN